MKRLSRILSRIVLIFAVLFILPALASFVWWTFQDRPQSWRVANWDSANILPQASNNLNAAIYIMAARTGGMKGALSEHSWIVLKPKGNTSYERYDKLGWGIPVRKNAYPADGNWYSNRPYIIKAIFGKQAEKLLPEMRRAVATYPYSDRGDYNIWPGPNSNSFVAHVLNSVPDLGVATPPLAVGGSYPTNGRLVTIDPEWDNIQLNWRGLFGIAVGKRHGLEINFAGLIAGLDFKDPALKIPGFGKLPLSLSAMAKPEFR